MEKYVQLTSLTSFKLLNISNTQAAQNSLFSIQSQKQMPPTSLDFLDFTFDDCDHVSRNYHQSFDCDNSLQHTFQKVSSANKLQKQQKRGCICKKTKCLKMYCQCFGQGKNCSKDCVCLNCLNTEENKQQIQNVRKQLVNKRQRLHKSESGCNCQKSNCQKKYCECYNSGNTCNQRCRCHGCLNTHGDSPEAIPQSGPIGIYNI